MKSKFDGGLLGLIGTGIVAELICLFTLGIGTPWAVCRFVRWYVSHATIDGKQLKFEGTGGGLFGQYIKWFLLCIVTLGIYSFWLTLKMVKWVVENIHIEGSDAEPAVSAEA